MGAKAPHSECLRAIRERMDAVIAAHQPDAAAIEGGFFFKNAKVAMVLGEVRGVAISCCAAAGVPVFEYSPRRAKQNITGWGAAPKEQVARMVMSVLGLSETAAAGRDRCAGAGALPRADQPGDLPGRADLMDEPRQERLRLEGVRKAFRGASGDVEVLRGVSAVARRGGVRGDHGAVGLGQDNAADGGGPAAAGRRRERGVRRPRGVGSRAKTSWRRSASMEWGWCSRSSA